MMQNTDFPKDVSSLIARLCPCCHGHCSLRKQVTRDISYLLEQINEVSLVNMIVELFERMEHADGGVTLEQLLSHIKDTDMIIFAHVMDAEELDLECLFELLTSHGKHPIDRDSFAIGCIKLRGSAKSVDVIDWAYDFRRLTMIYGCPRSP